MGKEDPGGIVQKGTVEDANGTACGREEETTTSKARVTLTDGVRGGKKNKQGDGRHHVENWGRLSSFMGEWETKLK